MNIRILIITLVVLASCSRSSNSNSSNSTTEIESDWKIENPNVSEELVTISFTNMANQSLNLIQPLEKKIEMFSGDQWVPVSVLYCDCENPCPAPPEIQSIENGGVFRFTWDKIMEDCITDGEQRVTRKTKASPGLYRINYAYSLTGSRERLLVQAEFTIE